jgi:hypothetical protein
MMSLFRLSYYLHVELQNEMSRHGHFRAFVCPPSWWLASHEPSYVNLVFRSERSEPGGSGGFPPGKLDYYPLELAKRLDHLGTGATFDLSANESSKNSSNASSNADLLTLASDGSVTLEELSLLNVFLAPVIVLTGANASSS